MFSICEEFPADFSSVRLYPGRPWLKGQRGGINGKMTFDLVDLAQTKSLMVRT